MKIYNARYDYNKDGLIDETDFEEFRKDPNVSRTEVANFGEIYLGADRSMDLNEEIFDHPVRPGKQPDRPEVIPVAMTVTTKPEMIPYESPGQESQNGGGLMQSSLFWPAVIIGALLLLPKIFHRKRS